MLVVTRTSGEGISVGDGIEVHVLSVSGRKVRIGIRAPREISIRRTELRLDWEPRESSAPSNSRSPRPAPARTTD
jgi:carbon storage regulator